MGTMTATVNAALAKVTLDITMAASVTTITVGRRGPDGFTTLIRYGEGIPTPGGHVVIDDFEAPLDVPIDYVATQVTPTGTETATSAIVMLTSGGYSWLKDPAYPSMNFRIPITTSIQTLQRPARAGVFRILDRDKPVTITTVRQSPNGELVLHTNTDSERVSLTNLLARGTTLLLQVPAVYAESASNNYVYVADVTETRVGLAMEQARRWSLPFTVVDRPEGLTGQPASGKTWGDVKTKYATWGDLAASGKTWQQLLEEGP